MKINQDEAESIAIQALGFLAEDEERLSRFFELTGLAADNIRSQAKSRSFQSSLLGYLMSDETLLLVFCANSGLDPSIIAPARHALDPERSEYG